MIRSCVRCQKTHSGPQAFLISCSLCKRAWHHRCHIPPVEDSELIARVKATNIGDIDNGLDGWECRRCTRGKVKGATVAKPQHEKIIFPPQPLDHLRGTAETPAQDNPGRNISPPIPLQAVAHSSLENTSLNPYINISEVAIETRKPTSVAGNNDVSVGSLNVGSSLVDQCMQKRSPGVSANSDSVVSIKGDPAAKSSLLVLGHGGHHAIENAPSYTQYSHDASHFRSHTITPEADSTGVNPRAVTELPAQISLISQPSAMRTYSSPTSNTPSQFKSLGFQSMPYLNTLHASSMTVEELGPPPQISSIPRHSPQSLRRKLEVIAQPSSPVPEAPRHSETDSAVEQLEIYRLAPSWILQHHDASFILDKQSYKKQTPTSAPSPELRRKGPSRRLDLDDKEELEWISGFANCSLVEWSREVRN